MAMFQTHKQPQTRIMVCSYTENESSGLNAKNVVELNFDIPNVEPVNSEECSMMV